jgi:hypothetical protein
MKTARTFLIVLTALLGAAAQADAGVPTFGFADIQNWTGTGANQAMLIIDWNNGNSSQSFAWGYHWNGAATGLDMLTAIAGKTLNTDSKDNYLSDTQGADTRLFLWSRIYSFGSSPTGLGYDVNNNQSKFVSETGTIGRIDSADFYAGGGWETGYWWASFLNSLGSSDINGDTTWMTASDGASRLILSNNDCYAWVSSPTTVWDGLPPHPPVAAEPIPEPLCLVVLLMGGAVLAKRRGRNAKAMDN